MNWLTGNIKCGWFEAEAYLTFFIDLHKGGRLTMVAKYLLKLYAYETTPPNNSFNRSGNSAAFIRET
jgi:hypothetical protein